MPSNQTSNYALNQWSKDDQVKMDDFNADNAKIDAALAQKADQSALSALTALVGTPLQMAAGHYAGDGTATRFISTGFTPRAVLVFTVDGFTYADVSSAPFGGLAVTDYPAGGGNPAVQIAGGGFNVFSKSGVATNSSRHSYNYIALG